MGIVGHESEPKLRIMGALMGAYVSKAVTLLGDITKVENDSKRATMCTTDGNYVQIIFVTPLNIPLNTSCLTEVYGIAMNRNQIQCHDFVQFPQDMSDKFDRKVYNDFVAEFVKVCDQHFNVEKAEEHDGAIISAIENFSMPVGFDNSAFDTSTTR